MDGRTDRRTHGRMGGRAEGRMNVIQCRTFRMNMSTSSGVDNNRMGTLLTMSLATMTCSSTSRIEGDLASINKLNTSILKQVRQNQLIIAAKRCMNRRLYEIDEDSSMCGSRGEDRGSRLPAPLENHVLWVSIQISI